MKTVTQAIKNRIIRKHRGWVFSPNDFEDIGSRDAIDKSLSRLATVGFIRRVTRGIYDYPRMSNFGPVRPDMYEVASVIARNSQAKIQVSEAYAANVLGLTTQVPGKLVFYTDGAKRTRKIGNRTLVFKQASPKKLAGAGRISGLVFQGLRYFGKTGVHEDVVSQLGNLLSDKDKEVIARDMLNAPLWMRPLLDQISLSEYNG